MCIFCPIRALALRDSSSHDSKLPCKYLMRRLRNLAACRERDPWIAEEAALLVHDDVVDTVLRGRIPDRPRRWILRVLVAKLSRVRRGPEAGLVSLDSRIEEIGDEVLFSSVRPQEHRHDSHVFVQVLACFRGIEVFIRPLCTSFELRILRALPRSRTIEDIASRIRSEPRDVCRAIERIAGMAKQVMSRHPRASVFLQKLHRRRPGE